MDCVQCHRRPAPLGQAACSFCWGCAIAMAYTPVMALLIFGVLYLLGVF